MPPTIFRKQTFQCAGCGVTAEAKRQVPAPEAKGPLGPPDGWGALDLTAQNSETGAIFVLSVPVCSEACGQRLAAGEGKGVAFVQNVQRAFSTTYDPAPAGDFDPPVPPSKLITP